MSSTSAVRLSCLALVLGAAARCSGAVTFTKVADWTTYIPGKPVKFTGFADPSNVNGDVAFWGGGAGALGVYSTAGGLHTVADKTTSVPGGSGTFAGFSGLVSMSTAGVAFGGRSTTGSYGIYADLGGLSRVADTTTPIPGGTGAFTTFYHPAIAGGRTAFVGTGASGQRGVYAQAGALSMIADTNTPIPGGVGNFTWFHDAIFAFDGQGAVFSATGSSGQAGVYSSAGALHAVADKNTPIPGGGGNFNYFGGVAADAGHVAFGGANLPNGPEGLYSTVGGLHKVVDSNTLVPDGSGTTFTNMGIPSLDGANVAFSSSSAWGDQYGLYAIYNGELLKIIQWNDVLGGKVVEGLSMSNEALDGNQVAFHVYFTDNTDAIYLATIPEPASLALLLLGALTLPRRPR